MNKHARGMLKSFLEGMFKISAKEGIVDYINFSNFSQVKWEKLPIDFFQ